MATRKISLWLLLAVAALLVCYVALGLSASRQMSQVGDEGAHLAGGVSYWLYNDYRIEANNGNWPQRLCGLPLWLSGYHFPTVDAPAWQQQLQWDLGDQFVYRSGNDADALLFRARTMTALLGVALGLLVFLWAKRLFGPLGGLLSLTAYAFSPATLTHGFLATTDMANALGFSASVAALWMLLHRVSAVSFLACWMAMSGLFLSKFSAPAVVPMGLLLLGVRLCNRAPLPIGRGAGREIRGRLHQLAVFAGMLLLLILAVALSIWASYGFRYAMINPKLDQFDTSPPWNNVEFHSPLANRAVDIAREYRLLPEAYLYGFSHVMHASEGSNAFLNGEFRRFGWLSFYPYCFAAKTPVQFFLMLTAAVAAIWCNRSTMGVKRAANGPETARLLYELAPLLVWFSVYWAFTLANHMDAGHRYLLPTYPPLFILVGAMAWWFQPPANGSTIALDTDASAGPTILTRAMRVMVAFAVLLSIVETVWFWPDYLAYFNVVSGGPRQAYRHLVDSSLDWSQDLKRAKAWLDAHPSDTKDESRLYFSFFGAPPIEYYGIHAQQLTSYPDRWQPHIPAPLTGGTYLISATMLQAVLVPYSGRWNQSYERQYQQLRPMIDAIRAKSQAGDPSNEAAQEIPDESLRVACWAYDVLRFTRLASFLRAREPDDEIGYSILVYRLSDQDIARALDGPPVEMLEMPEADAEELRRGGARAGVAPP
jgi:hypothetical protein